MKGSVKTALAMFAWLAYLAGNAEATTIGFVGAAGVNQDIPADYGSNIAADGIGWTVSDGTGATPNISLDWGNSTRWTWEFHNAGTFDYIEALHTSGSWDAVAPSNGVAQLQSDQPNGRLELGFSVIPGARLVLNSLDIGNATDQGAADGPYGFDITLIRQSDGATVWSHSTPLWDVEPDPPVTPRAPREESVAINYTGDLGEDYTLAFTRQGIGSGVTFRSGLDNLSFSEILTAAAPQFTLLVDRSTGAMSLKNIGGTAQTIKGYSITSEAGSLNHDAWKSIAGNYDATGNSSVDGNDNWTKLSQAGDSTDFSEFEFGGDGGTIAAGAEVALNQSGGDAWLRSPYEDLVFELVLADGNIYEYDVEYTGAHPRGDLNFDGVVSLLDWPAYHAGRGVDMSGMTAVEAYQLGDLNGDLQNNLTDFLMFKQMVVASANENVTGIPEPTTSGLFVAACALFCGHRSLKRHRRSDAISSRSCHLKRLCVLLIGVHLGCIATLSSSYATTIGFVGAANVNQDLPVNYGSNISSDGIGWTVSDGTGATPNIALYWGGAPDSTGWDWEFHNATTFQHLEALHVGGAWDAPAPPSTNGVVQLQSQVAAGRHEINFSPTSGAKFVLNSFDIGNATDQTASEGPYGFDISLIRDSDATTVWSHSTPEFNAGEQESVSVSYSGETGQSYTLAFARYGQGNASVTWRSGLDNLSFSEAFDVSPLKLVVNTTTGVVQIKNDSGTSYSIDSYEITSASNSLNPVGWTSLQDSDYEGNGAPGNGNGWEEAPGVHAGQLIEDYLLGSTAIPHGATISLGQAFDFSKVGAEQDLVFGYHVTGGGDFYTIGNSEYISPVIDADFDNDGVVDGSDFLIWQRGFGTSGATNAVGDADGDADVDGDDLAGWAARYGVGTTATTFAAAVPEPAAASLLVVAGFGWIVARRRRQRPSACCRRAVVASAGAAVFALLIAIHTAHAAKTDDRRYEFGDSGSGTTQDSEFVNASQDRQDLSVPGGFGSPSFVDVSSLGLNRPGAVAGDRGAQFDGINDVLSGIPLNRPDETAGPDIFGDGPFLFPFPYNYNQITARGLQMWVYPDASALGTESSPTARQGIVFDTRESGGVSITADGKWTQSFDNRLADGQIEATVPVVGNQWYHVMHHIYRSIDPGFPEPLSSGAAYTGVVYVNGIAVSASNGTVSPGQSGDFDFENALAVGSEKVVLGGPDPEFANHFKGVVDNLQMYVFGDNSSAPGFPAGQDYGTFDLFVDNDWIAAQIAAIPGGGLATGDVNRDGNVNASDVTDFVAGWRKEKKFKGAFNDMYVGDWETWSWGDMNLDGRVNLADAIILDESLITAGVSSGLNFNLLDGAPVPEPASWMIGTIAVLLTAFRRRRRDTTRCER